MTTAVNQLSGSIKEGIWQLNEYQLFMKVFALRYCLYRIRVTLWLTVSMSWCRADFVDSCPYIASFSICCPVSMGRPLWREARSVLCKSQSSNLSVHTFTINIFVFHTFITFTYIYIYTLYNTCNIYKASCSPGSLQQIMPYMTAAKFKPLLFPVSGFDLSNIANIFIFMILYDFCLLPTWFCYVIVNVRNLESHMHIADQFPTRETANGAENLIYAVAAISIDGFSVANSQAGQAYLIRSNQGFVECQFNVGA
jgi:hypothetical protein